MRVSRRIAVLAPREVKRLAAIAAERAAQAESVRISRPSFRPLSEAETEAFLGIDLLAALGCTHKRPDGKSASGSATDQFCSSEFFGF